MQSTDFSRDRPGKLVRNLDGHWTFVPHPLPGRLIWSNELGAVLFPSEIHDGLIPMNLKFTQEGWEYLRRDRKARGS
jgi:hypothetical protein